MARYRTPKLHALKQTVRELRANARLLSRNLTQDHTDRQETIYVVTDGKERMTTHGHWHHTVREAFWDAITYARAMQEAEALPESRPAPDEQRAEPEEATKQPQAVTGRPTLHLPKKTGTTPRKQDA